MPATLPKPRLDLARDGAVLIGVLSRSGGIPPGDLAMRFLVILAALTAFSSAAYAADAGVTLGRKTVGCALQSDMRRLFRLPEPDAEALLFP